MKKILTVSVLAMMAVSAANAEIASKGYVDQQIGTLAEGESVATTYQTKAAMVTVVNESSDDNHYPTAAAVHTAVAGVSSGAGARLDALETKVGNETVANQISTALANGNDAYQTASDVSTTLGDYYTETEADGKFQTLANKTTSLSSSSTDTQYPSAKAVYDADEAIKDTIGTVTSGKTVVEMINDAQTAATYDDTALAGRVSANETAIGNANSGLTKGVADNAAAISAINNETTGILATAKSYADGLAGNYDAAGDAATAEQNAKDYADGKFQTLANKTTDLSGTFADDTQYPSAKAVKAAISAAQTAATYDDTALAGRVQTAEGDIDALEQKVGNDTVANQISSAIGTGTLTVQMNGASAGTFGANASENATINLGNVITAPSSACTALNAKCVLTVGSNGYEWEVVQRGSGE